MFGGTGQKCFKRLQRQITCMCLYNLPTVNLSSISQFSVWFMAHNFTMKIIFKCNWSHCLSIYYCKWITDSFSAYEENMFNTWRTAFNHQSSELFWQLFHLSRVINYYVLSNVLNKPRLEPFSVAVWTQPLLETVYSAGASIWPAQISTYTACGRLSRSSLMQCVILPDYVPYVRVLANEQTST